jgi:hypothetical protein
MPNLKSGAEVKLQGLRAGLGFNSNVMPWPIMAGKMSEPDVEVNSTLKPVPRDKANLEAERGEVAMTPGDGGIPDTYKIGGKRHYEGGTPLNLPDDSFIFSDTAKMRIKDPVILAQFGMAIKKGGYTPADIAKKYNINKYKKVLADPDTDDLQKDTAEQMITNYNLKLAKLGLIQESKKGFPQGIPSIATPYLESMQIDPSEFVQMNPGEGDDETSEGDNMTAAYGGILHQLQARKYGGMYDQYEMAYGGLPKAQWGDWLGSAMEQTGKALSAPQRLLTEVVANPSQLMHPGDFFGNYQNWRTPSEAMGIQSGTGAFLTDLLLDPMNAALLGPEAIAKLTSMGYKAVAEKAAEMSARTMGKHVATNIGKSAAELALEHAGIIKKSKLAGKLSKEAKDITNMTEKSKVGQVLYNTGAPATRSNVAAAKAAIKTAEKQAVRVSATPLGTSMKASSAARQAVKPASELKDVLNESYLLGTGLGKTIGGINVAANLTGQTRGSENSEENKALNERAKNLQTINSTEEDIKIKKDAEAKALAERSAERALLEGAPFGATTREIQKNLREAEAARVLAEKKQKAAEEAKKYNNTSGSKVVPITTIDKSGGNEVEVLKKYGGAIDDYFVNGGSKKIKKYQYSLSKDKIRPVYEDDSIGDFEETENVLPEDKYNELVKLYDDAEKESAGNSNKYSPKTELFQRKYHEYLPNRARKIISADPQKTTHGLDKELKKYDLESNAEGLFGRRTKQYLADLKKLKIEKAQQQEEQPTTIAGPATTTITGEPDTTKVSHLNQLQRANPNPAWWLQDIIKTANAASDYATINKYNPWQATTPIYTPTPTYFSPERELAENAEQLNIGAQALSSFTGPQAFNSRYGEMQGKGAQQAADTLGRVNNLNVNLANAFSRENAALMNQAAAIRANEQTGLYDKNTIANQLFDNSKRQAKNTLVNNYVQAITNRANTASLNSLYPQFAVDPSQGGPLVFHDPRSFKPSDSARKTYQDYVREAIQGNRQLATASAADLNNAVKLLMMIDAGKVPNDAYAQYKQDKSTVQGYPNTEMASDDDQG